ncbi:MAG: hypothetical protein Q8T11_12080 [Elusimicrobiota bacterium]|nr:hypothetical protein [Elusimicrobiota bacterium]
MKNIPLTVVAAALLAGTLVFAGAAEPPAAPPPQDRTESGTDEKEVARAIAELPPDKEQLSRLLKTHRAARAALKDAERGALRALEADYADRAAALRKAQEAEKRAMIARMR